MPCGLSVRLALLPFGVAVFVLLSARNTLCSFYVFLTVHHSIDFSKYQLSAQFF